MENLDKSIKNHLSFLDDPYVNAGLSLFLILYAGLAATKLPTSLVTFLDNNLVKFVLFFLIAYVSRKDVTIALIAAVAVLVSLMALNNHRLNETMVGSTCSYEEVQVKAEEDEDEDEAEAEDNVMMENNSEESDESGEESEDMEQILGVEGEEESVFQELSEQKLPAETTVEELANKSQKVMTLMEESEEESGKKQPNVKCGCSYSCGCGYSYSVDNSTMKKLKGVDARAESYVQIN